jgi:hypothetical protein
MSRRAGLTGAPASYTLHDPLRRLARGQDASLDILLALVLAATSLLIATRWGAFITARQRQAFAAFGAHDDGAVYCAASLRGPPTRCIPRRSDHGAPGRRGRSPEALCAVLAAARVEPSALELPPCD